MFFRTAPRRQAVRVQASWYKLTDNWWPDCFWVKLSLLAKERRVSMRSPDKMAALVAELEGTYGEVILSDWPWVKQMQERRRANGAST